MNNEHSKRNKIIYWVATIWLGSALIGGGLQQIFQAKPFVDMFIHLGYPLYFLYLLGIWKILGTVAILIPKYTLLKEWAYAGIFFTWSGAIFSHIAAGDSLVEIFPGLILLTLTILSWYFRPANRKIIPVS